MQLMPTHATSNHACRHSSRRLDRPTMSCILLVISPLTPNTFLRYWAIVTIKSSLERVYISNAVRGCIGGVYYSSRVCDEYYFEIPSYVGKLPEIRPLHTTTNTPNLRFGQHTLFTTVTDTLKDARSSPRSSSRQRQQLFSCRTILSGNRAVF